MRADISPSTDAPTDPDDLFVIEQGPEAKPDPMRRRRAVSLLVTIGWMIFISALCVYVLMK